MRIAPRVLAIALVSGCPGPSSEPDGGPGPDGGTAVDGGPRDAGLLDGGPLSDAGFVVAAHRFFPRMPYGGGSLISPMTLVTLVAANDADSASLFAFSDAVVSGPWYADAMAEYSIAPPAQTVHVTGPAITANLTNAQAVSYIQQATSATNPPTGNNLYLLYIPAGIQITGASFCAYHEPYPDSTTTAGDDFAIVTRCTPYRGGETPLEAVTRVASHEIAEAATDPNGSSYTFGKTPVTPWAQNIWASYEEVGHVETGDLCEGTRIFIPGVDGGWDYQRIWSNDSATDGGDPCAPAQSEPYFNVSVDQDWYAGPPGGTVVVPIAGWSSESRGNWLVTTRLKNGSPAFLGQDGGFWQTQSQLGYIQLGPTCYSYSGINNGVSGTLTVNIPSNTASGDWAVFKIESFEEDPSTCYPPAALDDYHFWMVGLHVP